MKLSGKRINSASRVLLGAFALFSGLLCFASLLVLASGSMGFLGSMPEGRTSFIGLATIFVLFMMFLMDMGWVLCTGRQAGGDGLFSAVSIWTIAGALVIVGALTILTGEPQGWWPVLFAFSLHMFALKRAKQLNKGSTRIKSRKKPRLAA